MLIKDGSAPDKMSDGHRTYSGNDFTTRHWHFGKKSEKVMEGTCEKCVFGSGEHSDSCVISYNQSFLDEYFPIKNPTSFILTQKLNYPPEEK